MEEYGEPRNAVNDENPAAVVGSARRKGSPMTDRVTARVVGALFLVGTIAGLIGLPLQESVVGGDDYLSEASAHPDRLATGVLLQLVMGVAVVSIAVVIYPVLRRGTERLAMGYVVARVLEAVVYLVSGAGLLALITVSEKYVAADDASGFAAAGRLVMAQRDWAGHAILDAAVFSVGALVLNAALYLSRLVPRWLSLWGLVGAAAYLVAGLLVMYGLEPLSTPQVVLEAPLGLQEIALALWLIVKGFGSHEASSNPASTRGADHVSSATTKTTSTRQYRDSPVDVKLVLSALWITMLFVFAYVDIFAFFRADVLEAALDGEIATTGFTVNQLFLTYTLVYILLPALMVVLSLVLPPRINRMVNIVVSLLYVVTIIGGAIGETWAYYIIGSIVEVILLAAIARTAWNWPPPEIAPSRPSVDG